MKFSSAISPNIQSARGSRALKSTAEPSVHLSLETVKIQNNWANFYFITASY